MTKDNISSFRLDPLDCWIISLSRVCLAFWAYATSTQSIRSIRHDHDRGGHCSMERAMVILGPQ